MPIFPPSIGNWGEDKTNLKGPPGLIPVSEEGFRYIKVRDNPYPKMSVLTQRWSLSQCHDAECPRLFPEGKYQEPWHHSVTILVGRYAMICPHCSDSFTGTNLKGKNHQR